MEPFALHFSRCSLSFICHRANQRLIRSNCSYRCFKVPLQPHKTCFDPLNKTLPVSVILLYIPLHFRLSHKLSEIVCQNKGGQSLLFCASLLHGLDGPAQMVPAPTLSHSGGLVLHSLSFVPWNNPELWVLSVSSMACFSSSSWLFCSLSPFYNLSHHFTPTMPNIVHHK